MSAAPAFLLPAPALRLPTASRPHLAVPCTSLPRIHTPSRRSRQGRHHLIHASSSSSSSADDEDKTPSIPYRAQTSTECARDFLTQRAVQQTIFCAFELRDETTARWLEAFLGHVGLHDLHACDALRLPSRMYLTKLMQAPPEQLTIKKIIPGRTFRDNPYLQRRYFTYDVDVIPRTIARRVLDCRLQIAEELAHDLHTVCTDSERLTEKYRRTLLQPDGTPAPSDARSSELSIDLPPSYEATSGSPYRSATLDLAQNYTLFLALTTLSKDSKKPMASWIKALLQRRAGDLLRPYGSERGMGDQLIEELLAMTPTVSEDGSLFDPASVVQIVLEHRVACAQEWMQVVKQAREEHLDIERSVLEDDI